MGNVFFDFDGTLINSQGRLYNLFCELCPECNMTYDEYWNIKRNRITQAELLQRYFHYDQRKIFEFHDEWLKKIEEEKRLDTDVAVSGIEIVLQKILKNNSVYLVTNRQNTELTRKEIARLKWERYFSEILVTNQSRSKKELILKVADVSFDDILVSDTGEDINVAKDIGMRSAGVTWGVMGKECLQKYEPDYLVDFVNDLIRICK